MRFHRTAPSLQYVSFSLLHYMVTSQPPPVRRRKFRAAALDLTYLISPRMLIYDLYDITKSPIPLQSAGTIGGGKLTMSGF